MSYVAVFRVTRVDQTDRPLGCMLTTQNLNENINELGQAYLLTNKPAYEGGSASFTSDLTKAHKHETFWDGLESALHLASNLDLVSKEALIEACGKQDKPGPTSSFYEVAVMLLKDDRSFRVTRFTAGVGSAPFTLGTGHYYGAEPLNFELYQARILNELFNSLQDHIGASKTSVLMVTPKPVVNYNVNPLRPMAMTNQPGGGMLGSMNMHALNQMQHLDPSLPWNEGNYNMPVMPKVHDNRHLSISVWSRDGQIILGVNHLGMSASANVVTDGKETHIDNPMVIDLVFAARVVMYELCSRNFGFKHF